MIHAIALLFKIIRYPIESNCVPSDWAKGDIKPIPEREDPRNALNYKPITLILYSVQNLYKYLKWKAYLMAGK